MSELHPRDRSDSTPFILSVIRDSNLLGISTGDILRGPAGQGITSLDVRDATMSRYTGIVRRSKAVLSVVAEHLIDAIERAAKAEAL